MSLLPRRTPAPALMLALALLALGATPASAAPAPSPLSAQPSAQDFGIVDANWGEQSTSIWMQNAGLDPIAVGSSWTAGASALRVSGDGCNGQLLASGQGCNVGVGFDPSDGSRSDATLHVPVAGAEDLEVPLTGVGGVHHVTITPETLAFGAVAVGEGATQAFALENDGNLPFQSIAALPSAGDVGAFRVVQDDCSLRQLLTGEACDVSVRFTPFAPGVATATLLLVGGNDAPTAVVLRGSGVVAAVAAPAAPASPVATAATATAAAPPVADVAFDARAGQAASFAHGRIDLGTARCVEVSRCRVTVRPHVYAIGGDGAVVASVRSDVVLWNMRGTGRRATLALPAGLRGTPALLVATLRVRAAGLGVGTRTIVVSLVPRRRAR